MSLALWNHPVTAERYRIFTERHDRYRFAAEALVNAAGIAPGQKVLDVAAGIGCTSLACLEKLGVKDVVTAVEMAGAMRRAGETRTKGLPVDWLAVLPAGQTFDRVICGAALWAMGAPDPVIEDLAAFVAPGGVLAVSLPASYLGEPDTPGGGTDPWLTAIPEALSRLNLGKPPTAAPLPLTEAILARIFQDHGLSVSRTSVVHRLTQSAYCDWMTLPPVNDILLGKLDPDERPAVVADAARDLDQASWRWEAWALFIGMRPVKRSSD
jgi:SAM-dependent methyltransferase